MDRVRKLTTILGFISLVFWVASIIMLANGNKVNREEILKSRQANVEGRATIIQAIERVCAK
jgi:hypothetical protein